MLGRVKSRKEEKGAATGGVATGLVRLVRFVPLPGGECSLKGDTPLPKGEERDELIERVTLLLLVAVEDVLVV